MSKLQPYSQGRAYAKREIQRILDTKGKNFLDVAALAGVTKQAVYATVNGLNHSARVLDALRDLGVQERLLFDPRKSSRVA